MTLLPPFLVLTSDEVYSVLVVATASTAVLTPILGVQNVHPITAFGCATCWLCCTLCLIWLDFRRFRLLLLRNVVIDFVLFLLTVALHPSGDALLVLPIIIGVGMVLSIQTLPWMPPGHGQNLLRDGEMENVLHTNQAHPVESLPRR